MKIKSASGERGSAEKSARSQKSFSRQTASADESAVGLLGQLKIIHYPRGEVDYSNLSRITFHALIHASLVIH